MKTFSLFFLFFQISIIYCITHTVDIDGAGQYTSIQTAINASASGDTVLVYPGRYFENLNMNGHGISLLSLESITSDPAYIDSTIIDGNYVTACITVVNGEQNVAVRGFTLTRGKGGMVILNNSQATLTNTHIYNNMTLLGGGIMVGSSTAYFSGVVIHHNYSGWCGGGVYIHGLSNITFDNDNLCSIFSNTSARGQDIYVNDARTNINVNLDTFTIQNQSTYYAAYYNYPLYNYHLSIQYLHTVFQEINHDMYVSPNGDDANDGLTPETALRSINKAIYRTAQDSLNPKTVHLLEGNYSPTLNQQSFPIAMKSWVNLVGSGENSTNIHVESDPIMQVTNVSAIWFFMNTHCTISDFRITYATNIQSDVIFGLQEQYLVIRNIKIHELNLINHTLIIMQELTNSLIEGLDISDNTFSDGGILNLSGLSNGTIQNCKFTNCTSTGYSASVWMDPLIWITPNGDIQFENCVFDNLTMTDNDSQCISIGNSYLTDTIILEIRNCQFTNITGNPNSIYIAGTGNPNILIINSTFAGCTASNYALVTYGNVNITNSIFYNNIPYQFYIYPLTSGEHTSLTIDYSCIKNGLSSIANPGTGNQIHYQSTNITYDPAFLGGEENDPLRYSLSNISRCIDRGTPDTTGLALPIADLAGNYRIWNNRIDMGCYEFGSEPVDNDDDVQDPEVSSTLTNYPNPFNPSTIISYTTKQSGDVAIGIYNIRGQFVRNLVHEKQGAGNHMVEWDGKDTSGKQCGSGVYFCKLKTGNQLVTRKMALVK